MGTPIHEYPPPRFPTQTSRSSDEEHTFVGDADEHQHNRLHLSTSNESQQAFYSKHSPSQTREQEHRLDDDLAMLQAERVVSNNASKEPGQGIKRSMSLARSRSRRTDPVDEFDTATNPIHEKAAVYKPPENPSTNLSKLFKRIHNSSFLVRYFTYITPVALLILVPLLLGFFVFPNAGVGGVELKWFSIWLEIFWLTLWLGRIMAKMIPWPLGLTSSLFTNNSKKWRDMGKQLEIPLALFFWWLGVEISFLPTMRNHMLPGADPRPGWQNTMNRVIISLFVAVTLNLAEKIIIQLIAISFHLRTYADRIDVNKFQIGSLVKLYIYSKDKIAMEDSDFEDQTGSGVAGSGARTPMAYVEKAQKDFTDAFKKVGDVGAKVAGDFTGKQVIKSTHPNQVVLMLLHTNNGSQVLARRLYRTFIRDEEETVFADDMKPAFDNDDEAEAAFTMFDKDLNGDISMEELEAVCVEIGRERKSITASLKDLDSVVSKLDSILVFIVAVVTILVFITLISTSAAGVLTSLGGSVLALSWLFSATAQEFLQSIIFVFVKHPFDVGDRVTIYGNSGADMKGDDYFVKEISLLYTEFKKMEGHIVQAPNSYLNTLFILNMRRTGGLAEAVPMVFKFGTTLEQIEELRNRLLEFVKVEKRDYQSNILTEVRAITEAYSVSVNVVFFFKSNWQNELLRLQRRNKFFCAMMTFMQEIGIEGPYTRLPGQNQAAPFYVNYPNGEQAGNEQGPQSQGGPKPGSIREESFTSTEQPLRPTHSILRHTTSKNQMGRTRGDSVSSISKRVDFSLGQKGVGASDLIGDVHEETPQQRAIESVRTRASTSANRPQTIEEEDSRHSTGKSSAREESSIRARFAQPRTSVESHTNRFFGHHNRHHGEAGEDNLMERGMMSSDNNSTGRGAPIDPRSGVVSPQAFRMSLDNGEGSSHTNNGPTQAQSGEKGYEMKHLGSNDK